MLRVIAATVTGTVLAIALIFAIELVSHQIWPPPAGTNTNDPESVRVLMAQMPLGALLSVAFAWVLAAFVGGLVAAKIARRIYPAYIVGGLIALSGVANLIMMPHPVWFWAVALVVVPVVTIVAGQLGAGGRPVRAEPMR